MARKMNGLSGTKAHHAGEADKAFKESLKFFGQALTGAKAGNCRSAFANIQLGTAYRATAFSHRDEAKDSQMGVIANRVNDAEGDATDAFKASCLVSGGLSGMPRRRSRSRRRSRR